MTWLRARLHLFAPIALVVALIALTVDWALSDPTQQETLVTAVLGGGGLALLLLKIWDLRRRR